VEVLSKGKSDKHIDSFDSELEDDFFDAAFDMAFDEAFHQAVSATPAYNTESMRQSWLQVQKEIDRVGVRKKRMRTIRLSVIVAASVTIGAVIFSMPTGTQAVSPFVQSIKDWGNGMKSIVIEDRTTHLGADPSTAKTPPPPERGVNEAPKFYFGDEPEEDEDIVLPFYETSHLLEPIVVTKKIARSGFMGDFLLSKAIPERFTKIKFELMLDTLNPVNPEDYYESQRMRVRYSGEGKNGEEVIQFDYAYVSPGQIIEGPMLRETSIVKLADGSDAFMYLGPPYNTFQWMMGSVNMSLFGTVSEEEMIAIANDLQEQKFPGSTRK